MPKVGLSLGSLFEKLFHTVPDPSKLPVFGCLCFPWLRPFTFLKLDPKSSPCVFLGYSLTKSAFLCFDPTLKKIFVPVMSSLRRMFPVLFPPTPTPALLVIDIDCALLASSFTSGDLPSPSSLTDLSSTFPSPSPTSPQPVPPSSTDFPSNS